MTPIKAKTRSSTTSNGKSLRKLVLKRAVIVISVWTFHVKKKEQEEDKCLFYDTQPRHSVVRLLPLAWIQTPSKRQTVAPLTQKTRAKNRENQDKDEKDAGKLMSILNSVKNLHEHETNSCFWILEIFSTTRKWNRYYTWFCCKE